MRRGSARREAEAKEEEKYNHKKLSKTRDRQAVQEAVEAKRRRPLTAIVVCAGHTEGVARVLTN